MASDQDAEQTKKLRGFRIAAYGVYLLVVGVFSILVIISVVGSVLSMTPDRPPPAAVTASVRACLDDAEGLFRELDVHRRELSDHHPATDADGAWRDFRVTWLRRQRQAESRCAVEAPDRARLRAVFRRLEQAMDLYTTQSVQFSGEVGPAVDALRRALSDARAEAPPG